MYKDKDKQKEAGAERQRRYKAKQKALLSEGVTIRMMPEGPYVVPAIKLHPAIIASINRLSAERDGTLNKAEHNRRMAIAKAYEQLYPGRPYTGIGIPSADMPANPQPVRVSKPGDADYRPLCKTTREWCEKGGALI